MFVCYFYHVTYIWLGYTDTSAMQSLFLKLNVFSLLITIDLCKACMLICDIRQVCTANQAEENILSPLVARPFLSMLQRAKSF